MIIKQQLSAGHSVWNILENCRDVRYSDKGLLTSPRKFMNEIRNSFEVATVNHSRMNPESEGTFNYLSYHYEGKIIHVLFDGAAYICNDDGKTIHKFNPFPEFVYEQRQCKVKDRT